MMTQMLARYACKWCIVLVLVLVVLVVCTLLGFSLIAKELFGFAVVPSVFVFFGKELGVWDEVEVAEAFVALVGVLGRHHRGNLV